MANLGPLKSPRFSRVALGLLILTSSAALALTPVFRNLPSIARAIGFSGYGSVGSSYTVKVAILDNGFRGYAKAIGKSLPANTTYHKGPVAVDPKAEEIHGLFMAQILAGLLNYAPDIKYELHLFSAFGYSNLEAAVKEVADGRYDVVLYSQVWEYGGNGDTRGFINALVNQALASGELMWINAAGNFADGTYSTAIEDAADDWIHLPGPNETVRVRCQKGGKCPLRVVLSWNDFSDDVDTGTDKDLDLILTDDTLKIVGSSALKQMKKVPEDAPGASLYPRELINQMVAPGLYQIRVKNRSRNFDKNKDRLRITVSGERVALIDTAKGETILPPADNPRTITVGASDSMKSSSSARLRKPELVTPSLMTLANGDEYKGSSNAAAVTAAAAVILKAINPGITRERLIASLSGGRAPDVPEDRDDESGSGPSLETLGFGPTGRNCFRTARLPYARPELEALMRRAAGVPVQTTKGLKIFLSADPSLLTDVLRVSDDDMIVSSPRGFEALPRSNQDYLPGGFIEVVQTPRGQSICGGGRNDEEDETPTRGIGRRVKLPPAI